MRNIKNKINTVMKEFKMPIHKRKTLFKDFDCFDYKEELSAQQQVGYQLCDNI